MITLSEVLLARQNQDVFINLYKQIFFDGNKPKLRMWLVNKKVPYQELDDVESIMKICFCESVYRYNQDKIAFEKYVWTDFNFCLLNHFQSKKSKKKSSMSSIDDPEYEFVTNLGKSPDFECAADYEDLFMKMTNLQASICRLMYYNEWDKELIIEFLNISKARYNLELKEIRTVFAKYLNTTNKRN